jgi:hypothetical protein
MTIRVEAPQEVSVWQVTVEPTPPDNWVNYLWLTCGHIQEIELDETNESLVGAETICRRHHECELEQIELDGANARRIAG